MFSLANFYFKVNSMFGGSTCRLSLERESYRSRELFVVGFRPLVSDRKSTAGQGASGASQARVYIGIGVRYL